jgi:hypothetical protein
MSDVVSYSRQIKSVADEILSKTDFIKVLSEFGEVIVGGSYKYDLMWGPDVDVVVKCEDPRQSSVLALRRMIDLRLFQKYEYGDFVNFKRENRPESYIVNLRLPYAGQTWEIETWFFREIPENPIEELIKTKLTEESKAIILEMKKRRDESGSTKHQISSMEIYKRVLVDGVKNFEDIV